MIASSWRLLIADSGKDGIAYGPIRTASAICMGVARSSGGALAPGMIPPSATT